MSRLFLGTTATETFWCCNRKLKTMGEGEKERYVSLWVSLSLSLSLSLLPPALCLSPICGDGQHEMYKAAVGFSPEKTILQTKSMKSSRAQHLQQKHVFLSVNKPIGSRFGKKHLIQSAMRIRRLADDFDGNLSC